MNALIKQERSHSKTREFEKGKNRPCCKRKRGASEDRTSRAKASICAAMAKLYSTTFLAICATIVLIISCLSSTVYGGQALSWIPTRSRCEDSIGGCLGGDEFEFDSEISRRILATTQYISYAALLRNSVPCSRRGASYYNCQPGAQANPYNRGCSAITRCRS